MSRPPSSAGFTPIPPRPCPVRTTGLVAWVRGNLFSSVGNTLTTLFVLALGAHALPGILQWGLVQAVFAPDASACQAARGSGACWGVVAEKYRLILLGRYPFDEHWRPVLATGLMLAGLVISCVRVCWKPWLVLMWVAIMALFFALMGGGVMGLTPVRTDLWGGLPLTVLLATVSISNTAINQTGRAVECIALIMLVYLSTSLLTSGIMNWYNRRAAIKER